MSREKKFTRTLLKWWIENKRDFPWRENGRSPFEVLIAEVLLRKTRAESVLPTFHSILKKYPTPADLSAADFTQLSEMLHPIGLYNIRAQALVDISKILVGEHGGQVPGSSEELTKLPHVGRYIANAVLCLAFGEDVPLVDANIQRILERVFDEREAVEIHKADYLWDRVLALAPRGQAKDFNLALIDFGALVCASRNPSHSECPISDICSHFSRTNKGVE